MLDLGGVHLILGMEWLEASWEDYFGLVEENSEFQNGWSSYYALGV